jgi:large subunit ribosomal protein L34
MLAKLKKRKRLRTHGYLERTQSANGRKVLRDRRRKGRHSLTVSVEKRFQNVRGKSKLHIIAGGKARVISIPGSTKRIRAK